MTYKAEKIVAYHALRNLSCNADKSREVRKTAERILDDSKLFKEYVLLRIERKKDKERKEKIDALSGWRKWFNMVLPDSVILG